MKPSRHLSANDAVSLLQQMIAVPSLSRSEDKTADLLSSFLEDVHIPVHRLYNNVWAYNATFSPDKPTLLLNSHHDTVKPSPAYTLDPFSPVLRDGRLWGLGSNDAGASVVSLVAAFVNHYEDILPFNMILLLGAEEEVMGEHGMRAMVPHFLTELGVPISMALVGEPTGLDAAVGERGLVVLDGCAHGIQGHAAREEGVNAIYEALKDIETLRTIRFEHQSPLLGPIKVTTTQIQAGFQHNVVPDRCEFVVDVRTTDAYTNEEVVTMLQQAVGSELRPRSTRIRASAIEDSHILVRTALKMGCRTFVSPTTSDMALMPFPSLKLGVGQSSRSHSADEYVEIREIEEGVDFYNRYITSLSHTIYETLA